MTGSLVVVATPIGNLGDMSRRALEVLEAADVVYCEDTRHSRQLFSANQLSSSGKLRALHEHNEASLCQEVVDQVRAGSLVALVSDAGTPGVSDPGARVIAAVANAGLVVTTTPGPSAVIAALSVSGLGMDRFVMEGFVPRKAGERAALFALWQREIRTVVFYESPQRLSTTLAEMVTALGSRRVAVCREITKMHEEVVRGTVESLANEFASREVRGEIVVVLEGAVLVRESNDDTIRAALLVELDNGLSVRDAANFVSGALDAPHRRVYELALALRRENGA